MSEGLIIISEIRRYWTKPENLAYTDLIFFVFILRRLAMRFYVFRELIATDTP
jgi:hypothetical protein